MFLAGDLFGTFAVRNQRIFWSVPAPYQQLQVVALLTRYRSDTVIVSDWTKRVSEYAKGNSEDWGSGSWGRIISGQIPWHLMILIVDDIQVAQVGHDGQKRRWLPLVSRDQGNTSTGSEIVWFWAQGYWRVREGPLGLGDRASSSRWMFCDSQGHDVGRLRSASSWTASLSKFLDLLGCQCTSSPYGDPFTWI